MELGGVLPSPIEQGIFAAPDAWSRVAALDNPEWQSVFNIFDRNHDGTIDVRDLGYALSAIKTKVEAGTMRAAHAQPFQSYTVISLASLFAGSSRVITYPQFAEMLLRVKHARKIFKQFDM